MYTSPFGAASTPRPPRVPTTGVADVFVLGVYPSALHVRWTLPKSSPPGLPAVVGAMAVADEPTVFWDGVDAQARVEEWAIQVGFRVGDGPDDHGHVVAAGNGTSGRPVRERVLNRLGVQAESTWFTDAVNCFFVKGGTERRRQQADVIRDTYNPFAATRPGLAPASLPLRPSPGALVDQAVTGHRDRLRRELAEADAPVIVTLGEEARRVLLGVVDTGDGQPLTSLTRGGQIAAAYGRPGTAVLGARTMTWYALVHPGNRDTYWTELHSAWSPM